uniref:Uncharacterized protein n=1 Tax=Siphoviridae sp. ctoSr5 TaxID=2826460 RepID=A0A8S5MVY1_9CAUD|nr:MAG TPA: hypothetical protein [Siphoviridae sp. ctoSr5]
MLPSRISRVINYFFKTTPLYCLNGNTTECFIIFTERA